MYSLQQKQCTTALNEKSRVLFEVNFFENLHASTYDFYNYIYKVKKPAAESTRPPAAVRRGHSICTRAHYYKATHYDRKKESSRHAFLFTII